MSQEIELYSKINEPIDAIERLGTIFARSGMFGCDKIEQGQVLAWACIAERKTPIEIKRRYHLQNGELSTRADAILADFHTIIKGDSTVISRTPEKAAIELTKPGKPPVLFSFTWEEALKEPFVYAKDGRTLKRNYASPRARMQMLWARVISDGVRTLAPEIVSGTYTPEEIDDYTPERPGKELLPPATPETKAADPKPAKVTEVRTAEPATNSNEAANAPVEGTPVAAEVVPAARQKPTVSNWTNPKDPKKVSAEGAAALADIIPADKQELALRWLEGKKWILPAGGLLDLSPQHAKAIYEQPEAFLSRIAQPSPVTATA